MKEIKLELKIENRLVFEIEGNSNKSNFSMDNSPINWHTAHNESDISTEQLLAKNNLIDHINIVLQYVNRRYAGKPYEIKLTIGEEK